MFQSGVKIAKHLKVYQKHDKQLFPLITFTQDVLNDFSYFLWIYCCLYLQTFASQDGLTLVVIATFQAPHAPHG